MKNQQNPKIRRVDADGLANNTESALVIVQIKRNQVEACNIASLMERLLVLTDTPESVKLYAESVVFQVEGYDGDPRELTEIPEVRAFFARAVAEWPFWLYFLARGYGSIVLLMSLLCQVKVIRRAGVGIGIDFVVPGELDVTMQELMNRAAPLLREYGVPMSQLADSAGTAALEVAPALGLL